MGKFLKFLLMSIAGLILLQGCGTAPIYNAIDIPVKIKKDVTNDEIFKAIQTAGISKGWIVTKESDGVAKATLNIRSHQAVVAIPYSRNGYSIKYVSSVNLDSDGEKIHTNYNGWIGYLKQAIDVQLSALAD